MRLRRDVMSKRLLFRKHLHGSLADELRYRWGSVRDLRPVKGRYVYERQLRLRCRSGM